MEPTANTSEFWGHYWQSTELFDATEGQAPPALRQLPAGNYLAVAQ